MTPTINHIYSCTWEPGGDTYINLVTDVSHPYIYGRCLYSTDRKYFDDSPDDAEYIKWKLSYWDEDSPDATILDLGYIDDLPEFFI